MAAWLVCEDPYGLVRLDSIVSVTAIPLNDRAIPIRRWEELHPDLRIREARRVRIMVAGESGPQMCALTCPGLSVRHAIGQLVALIENPPGADDKRRLYVYGHRRSWGGNADIWRVAEKLPDPDYPPVRP
ncbi:hypothetical protein [Nonomuraea turcica]|uniref:hypothetical protein n=1 Tax=Nonomuraea sp. G32 TaxID=3067274 RepID=UPI00273ABC6A|nr:hypothetical protein [Nonomuraea sp. G32]MDP4501137.1 hypothetical protein [Nonomuraea sp. G32]